MKIDEPGHRKRLRTIRATVVGYYENKRQKPATTRPRTPKSNKSGNKSQMNLW